MKAWKWFSSRRQKLLFSFLINVLYLLTLLILMRPIEVTDDDLLFKTMCNGVYGSYNAHMVLINCLLGKFLNGLYMIFPTIEWFDCIQYIILLISFSIITYVIINELLQCVYGSYNAL
jgi:hypothetical protein